MKNTFNLTISGQDYIVRYEETKFISARIVQEGNSIMVFRSELSENSHREILVEWLKEYSYKVILERAKFFSREYSFSFKSVTIRDQISRWGSCSSSGKLNFNWRLILAHPKALDYVVVHELAHTEELNHSINFWAIVEAIMPEYKVWEKWLRYSGRTLFKVLS